MHACVHCICGCCCAAKDHGHNDVVMKRSTDGGKTFGPVEIVYGESGPTKNVTIGNEVPIYVLDNKNIVLVACRNNKEVLQVRTML